MEEERHHDEEPSEDMLLLSLLGVMGPAPSLAWDYLTIRDRMQLLLVSKTVKGHLAEIEYTHCKDGASYRVPFPGFPGLLPSDDTDENNNGGLFPHQLASLQACYEAENSDTRYGALRGGILADAPGLGKSITLLALITSTAGRRPTAPPEFWDPERIAQGWKAVSQNPGFQPDILKTLQPFRELRQLYTEVVRQVKPPFSLDRFPTIRDFERYVQRKMKQYATETELEQFRQNVILWKASLDKSSRKILKSEAGRRVVWERSLIPTSATLLVVPDGLLEHWFQQIHLHWNRALFADSNETASSHDDDRATTSNNKEARGVVYLDGVGDLADARMPLGNVNMRSMELLKPWQLAKYQIVVTTFSRCELEYRREVVCGRMGQVVHRSGKRKRLDQEEEDGAELVGNNNPSHRAPSSLLQMRWLRICIDEGHELGQEIGNGLTRFIQQIAAERRWVLSGTPTTGDEDDEGFLAKALDQLQRLLLFLRHPVYGAIPTTDTASVPSYKESSQGRTKKCSALKKKEAKATWVTQVKNPFLNKKPEGRNELLKVLRSVMIMHRKEDIHLPKPIFRQIEVNVPIPKHVQDLLKQNAANSASLLDEYLYSDDFQSLVDDAQGEYIVQAIQQAKDALQKRGGPLQVNEKNVMKMLSAHDVDEGNDGRPSDRRPIKAVVYSSNQFNLRDVEEAMYKSLELENIAEAYDNKHIDCTAELSRFRNNRKECRDCPVCGYTNDYGIRHSTNRRKGAEPKCWNTLLEVVSRHDPNVRFLVEPERVVRAIPVNEGGNVPLHRLDGLSYTRYRENRRCYRVGDLLEVDIRDPHPVLKKRENHESWQEYGSEKCVELAEQDGFQGKDWFFGPLPVLDPDSEYNNDGSHPHIMQVELAKWQFCGQYHNHSRWFRGPRLSQAAIETIHQDVFVLALDASLAHGLDLSFVTHIYLLEPIEDAALLEQITSRAHRLGATGPVTIETVNTFYQLDPATQAVVEMSKQHQKVKRKQQPAKASKLVDYSRRPELTKVVCQYCYRQFDSMQAAVSHEEKQCPRNPANIDVVDPYHLSSVYREIRPPPPRMSAPRSRP
jgi:hypothetical protein